MPTHFMNIWAKFHSNTSITHGHVVSHEISVNRKQTPDGRKDGQRTDGGTTQKHDAFHLLLLGVGRGTKTMITWSSLQSSMLAATEQFIMMINSEIYQ